MAKSQSEKSEQSDRKSRWLHHDDMEPVELSPEVWAFEQWLTAKHYELAVDVCPRNDGEFFGAVDACEVLGDYLDELEPQLDDPAIQGELERYANELGEVALFEHDSDQEHDDFSDDDEPDNFDPEEP